MRDPLNELRERLANAMLDGTGFLRGNRFDALVLADLCVPLIRAALADAWVEGLGAGCDRWMDNREFGDPPVNPYRERS